MITVTQNPNFTQWFKVFVNDSFFNDIKGRVKAMRIAKRLANKHKRDFVNLDGDIINTKEI